MKIYNIIRYLMNFCSKWNQKKKKKCKSSCTCNGFHVECENKILVKWKDIGNNENKKIKWNKILLYK